MEAFDVRSNSAFVYVKNWQSQVCLPQVECPKCGETQWSTDIWYPSLLPTKKIDSSKLSDDVIVSPPEFKSLCKAILGRNHSLLQPGAGVGIVRASLPNRASDFFWCEGRPIISLKVAEILETEKFVTKGSIILDLKTNLPTNYYAFEVPCISSYSTKTAKQLSLEQCETCHGWNIQNLSSKVTTPREYVEKRIPFDVPLIRPEEGAETIANPRFKEVAQRHKFTGIQFKEWGIFV